MAGYSTTMESPVGQMYHALQRQRANEASGFYRANPVYTPRDAVPSTVARKELVYKAMSNPSLVTKAVYGASEPAMYSVTPHDRRHDVDLLLERAERERQHALGEKKERVDWRRAA